MGNNMISKAILDKSAHEILKKSDHTAQKKSKKHLSCNYFLIIYMCEFDFIFL